MSKFKIPSTVVYVPHKTLNYAFSRRSRAKRQRDVQKKRDARVVLLIKPIALPDVLVASPSRRRILKSLINLYGRR